MVGQLESLHLRGTWFEIIELTLDVKNALLGTLVALLVVHRSLRKQAYGHLLNSIKERDVDLDLGEDFANLVNMRLCSYNQLENEEGV